MRKLGGNDALVCIRLLMAGLYTLLNTLSICVLLLFVTGKLAVFAFCTRLHVYIIQVFLAAYYLILSRWTITGSECYN